MDLYREELLDHWKNPRNFGDLPGATHRGREANASCGDLIEFSLKIRGVRNKELKVESIEDVRFKGVGCALSIAAASMLTEKIKNQKMEIRIISEMSEEDVVKMLGVEVTPTRMKCAMLPLVALKKAIREVAVND